MTKIPLTPAEKSKRYRDKKRAEKLAVEAGEVEPKYVLNIEVSKSELERLTNMGVLRAGCREPYSPGDYAAELIRNVLPDDEALYQEQAKALGTCKYCNTKLPIGCAGLFKGRDDCYHTIEYRKLELSRVTLTDLKISDASLME